MLTCAVTNLSCGQNRGAVRPVSAVPSMSIEEHEMDDHCTVRRRLSHLEQQLDGGGGSAFLLRVEFHDVERGRWRAITFLVRRSFPCTGWCTFSDGNPFSADIPNSPSFLDFRHF